MPRMKSEMFEEYFKLADKVGLTKMAEDSSELKKYKDDVDSRMGSDDISTIEALYGIKPEGQEYEFNIMEQAHPNSVVISPSYDKLNGLVENNIERQNIMINLVLDNPSGNHTKRKYAQSELVMELVRVANEMDARNKEDLYKLADECLEDITKEAFELDDVKNWFNRKFRNTKSIGEGAAAGAGIGAAIGGLLTAWTGAGVLAGVPAGAATGAAIGGLLAAFTKTEPAVTNVTQNAKELSIQLKDLYKKTPESSEFFQKIDAAIVSLIESSQQYLAALNVLKQHEIDKSGDASVDNKAVEEAAKNFLEDVKLINKYHSEFERRNKSGEFSKAKPSKSLTPVYWFMQDDIEDVEDAFNSLQDAIIALQDSVKEAVQGATKATSPVPTEKKDSDKDESSFIESLMSGHMPW